MDRVLEIGEPIVKTFDLSWPTGFNAPIIKEIKTRQLMKKHIGAMKVFGINVIDSTTN